MSTLKKSWIREAPQQFGIFLDVTGIENFNLNKQK